jgi:hypothetical protein
VGGNEVPVMSVLDLCIILSQKDKVMCTYRLAGMPRDNKILRKPFKMEDIIIR